MKIMNILHISNDFPNSSLYKQLVMHLDKLGLEQTIYSAVRSEQEASYNPEELAHIEYHIKNILSLHDQLLFRLKIRKIFKDLCQYINVGDLKLVHAHTLYSDGAVALKIKQEYGIPYVVAIRNTGVNIFQKYRPDLRYRKDKILREASKVIFITPAYHDRLLSKLDENLKRDVKEKLITIPNGIDSFFLEHSGENDKDNSSLKVLYVGKFIKRKNIKSLIKAVELLRNKKPVKLTLVGGSDDDKAKIKKMLSSDKYAWVDYLGQINSVNELRQIYASHDIFAMTSYNETFGLVYTEALSQGVPILLTKGEGVDGYFEKEDVSETVKDPYDVKEIAQKIGLLADRLDNKLKKRCIASAKIFDWSRISQ